MAGSDTQAAIAAQLAGRSGGGAPAPQGPGDQGGGDPREQVLQMLVQALDAGIVTPDDLMMVLQMGQGGGQGGQPPQGMPPQ